MSLSNFISYYCLHYTTPKILHIISRKCWYSLQINSWWLAIPKISVYLISWFYSNRENWMLAKYTCFTVYLCKGTQQRGIVARLLYYRHCDRQRINSQTNRAKHNGFCPPDLPTSAEMCTLATDKQLFSKTVHLSNHVLHALLPPHSVSSPGMWRSWSKFPFVKCEFWLSKFVECECE